MPCAELLSLVAPYYSKSETGRKPVGLAIMLRVYFLQQRFSLLDPAAEDALYESAVLRRFAGVGFHLVDEDLSAGAPDSGRAPAPDEATT
jgi:IS5 family transposase